MRYQLGFVGAGNMAQAIIKAAIQSQVLQPGQMVVFAPTASRLTRYADLGLAVAKSAAQVIQESQQVMLAVKPQVVDQIAGDLTAHLSDDQIVISIMAGITSQRLIQLIGRPCRIVRVMPNTPLMVGCGMTGIATGGTAQADDAALAIRLFSAAGQAMTVREDAIDAITAVSGSGPAYVFYLAEAMQQAAKSLGLGEHADLLVRQTILGAAKLLGESNDTPGELRRKVTSPGGTTEAAIKRMDQAALRDTIVQAVQAAHARSIELGR